MESTRASFCFLILNLLFLFSASSIPGFPDEALPTKSGYLPINPSTGSAIFYTFYEAQQPTSPLPVTPLVIWLQGGPGCSSMIAYFSGLINANQKTQMEKLQEEAVKLIKEGNWSEATDARNRVLKLLQNSTGLATLYDFTRQKPYEDDLVTELLKPRSVKKALGVNESVAFEMCSDVVGKALHEDVMKSVKYMVEYLVSKSRVLLYQGHFDLRDGVVSTEAWMKKMKWEGIERFLEAERKVWRVDGKLAGFVQKWERLSHVVVLGAGHLVPADQPLRSQVMIEDWILKRGMFGDDLIGVK